MRRTPGRFGGLLFGLMAFLLTAGSGMGACPDQAPALLLPAAFAQQAPPVTFQWTAVSNVIEYRLLVSGANDFLITQYVTVTSVTLMLPPGQYQWRVEIPPTPGCGQLTTETRTLTVAGQLCPDAIPFTTAPAVGERVQSPVTLSWTAVPNAKRYAVQLFKDGAQLPEQLVEQTSVKLDLAPGAYDWVVETRADNCPAMRAPFAFFVIPAAGQDCSGEPPRILSPMPAAETTSPVELSWTAVRGATEYRVRLTSGGVETVKSTTGTKLLLDLQPGGYDWMVEALATGCNTLTSPMSFFRLVCRKGAPELSSPAPGATVKSPVEFKWSAVADVRGYTLLIRLNGQIFSEITTPATSHTHDLPPGEFEWIVMADHPGCPLEASPSRAFSIAGTDCSSGAPELVAPEDGARLTSVPVTVQWTSVPGAFAYQLLLAPAGGQLTPVEQTKETSLKLPLPPGRYRWGVIALRGNCPPAESAFRGFELQASGSCASAVPAKLIAPAAGAILQPPVDFSWSPVEGAIESIVHIVRPDGTATPAAATQRTTARIDWLPAAKLTWFVGSIVPGCALIESDRSSFEVTQLPGCPDVRPFALTPPDGAENVPTHVRFEWTPVKGASAYQIWTANDLGEFRTTGSETAEPWLETDVTAGRIAWYVSARVANCPFVASEPSFFVAVAPSTACGVVARPAIAGGAAVQSGQKFTLRWAPVPGAASFELQEDSSPLFTNPTTKTVASISAELQKQATTPTAYAYRVRAVDSCKQPGPYSLPMEVIVEPTPSSSATEFSLVTSVSARDALSQDIFIPGSGSRARLQPVSQAARRRGVRPSPPASSPTFTATTDVPWMKVTPSSGALPAAGTTIHASIDPALLPAGTSRGTVTVTTGGGSGLRRGQGTGGTTSVVSVSLITPVAPGSSSAAARDAILIPLVTEGSSASSALVISNLASRPRKYELVFIPTDVDGTKNARKTSVQIEPGDSALLEQILRNWFGTTPGTTTRGSLEIRPQDLETTAISTGPLTIASALMSSALATGTLQTFVPKLSLGDFIQSGTGGQKLVIPDIHSSEARSTGIGLMESAGEAATAKVTVYDSKNTVVAQTSVDLRSREETLLDDVLSKVTVAGGRAEIELTSKTGRVAAFAHSVDTRSSDEQIVTAVVSANVASGLRILPEAVRTAADSNGRSETTDLWLHNQSSATVAVTMTFYPEGKPSEKSLVTFNLAASETKLLEDVIGKSFQSSATRGSITIDPGSANSLIVSAHRVQSGPGGTYWTPLTPVTSSDGVGAGGRSLHILHARASTAFQTDLTLLELSGKEVTAEIIATVPESKSSPTTSVTLAANEMKRISPILGTLGLTNAHNVRLSVRVTAGSGRVWAAGTLVDLATNDRSVIPAE